MTKAETIMHVRGITGARVMDAKRALEDSGWNVQAAIDLLLRRNQGRTRSVWTKINLDK